MRIAMLGCGYVANMYRLTLPAHPELILAGVYDRETSRAETFARLTGAPAYSSFEALLADPDVGIVLNLTNPGAHFETTRALLEAGKHVYSEKPLAMEVAQARALVQLAEARGLMLCSAPCTLLNRPAQTLWKALRDGLIGPVRLVYVEMEDGMVPRAPIGKWVNEAGMVWPAVDEFQVGCTVEHAGYVLSWLCAFFGPAERVAAYSDTLLEDKIPGLRLQPAPDYSVASIRFRSGVVARMTNGLYAEHDHALRIFGDEGVLSVADPRSDDSPVVLRRYRTLRRRRFLSWGRRLPPVGGKERIARYRGSQTRDFCRTVADMAAALREGRPPYFSARFGLHVTELTLACHYAGRPPGAGAGPSAVVLAPETDFAPIEPASWAR